jgi:hypothetical protein
MPSCTEDGSKTWTLNGELGHHDALRDIREADDKGMLAHDRHRSGEIKGRVSH